MTDLQLGGTILLASTRVGVNPLEIVDLVAGVVGLDPASDDPERTPPPKDGAAGNVVPSECQGPRHG